MLSEPPTAIVCYKDLIAIDLMHRYRESNLSIAKNCSVVGSDNIAISASMIPPLTTFDQPKYELGYAAARMMMNLLNHEIKENQATKTEVLRGTLIIRELTAPPKV